MDDEGLTKEFFLNRIEQLEHERDELRKDIEQLCMQQAGPSYLAVATRMHFQRTAGLEQEIEILKKKLAGCLREKQNLQEELSETYRIKTQLADLHNAEVLKNKEVEQQMKFFQGSVAAAFSERDHSLMESEKARELEEAMLQKLKTSDRRVEELESAYNSEKERNVALEKELFELKEQLKSFEKVINKFYGIRERDAGPSADHTWQSRCSCLLDDSLDKWIFNSSSRSTTLTYISSLEEEIESRKQGIEQLQNNMRMGLQIEQHLKRSVRSLGKKQVQLIEMFESRLSSLHNIHNQHRVDVVKLLEEEMSHMKAALLEVHEKLRLGHMNIEPKHETFQAEAEHLSDDNECKDVHISNDIDSILSFKETDIPTDIPSSILESRNSDASETLSQALQENETDIPSSSLLECRNSDASETLSQALQEKVTDIPSSSVLESRNYDASKALSQALQEKVAALLLLSQQEERHLLERETNVALQHKIEELQKNLAQVASEKIEALMELAQLKCEYQILRDSHAMKYGDLSAETIGASISLREREGIPTNLLKKTSLKRWIGKDFVAHDTNVKVTNESNVRARENYSVDFARMKVENAALQESISNMEHLTSSIHRLHVSLLKIRDVAVASGFSESMIESLSSIIAEANQVKTAFRSSLPVSWSGDPTVDAITYESLWEPVGSSEDRRSDRVVFSAGFEMVELLILATQLLRNTDMTACTS